jgi:lipoate-protein ligase A
MILVNVPDTRNPYLNLAMEEYLLRNADCSKGGLIFFYINQPCVVVGKNQSIYKEVNFEALRSSEVLMARRISGGGTVYHDEGNLSFGFIDAFDESKVNNYKFFNQYIVEALNKMKVPAEFDTRNNIVCNGKKISGNAQFTNRKNILSHGTLLFNADLNLLRASLTTNPFEVESKSVASVKSSVANLSDITSHFSSIESLKEYLINAHSVSGTQELSSSEWNEIELIAKTQMSTSEWIYGRSPATTVRKNALIINVENGRIVKIEGLTDVLSRKLIGASYSYSGIKKALEDCPNASEILELVF